jgi:hypothetical protein
MGGYQHPPSSALINLANSQNITVTWPDAAGYQVAEAAALAA